MLLLLPILVPLIGGIFVFRQKNETYRDWLVVTLIVITAVMVLANCTMPTQRLWLLTIQGDLGLVLNSDWLSKFFMVLAVCIWAPVVVFTKPYIRHAGQGNQFMGFYTMTLGVLMGLAQAANFVTMYMFFEMMSLITVPLVLHNATPAARRAGFKYLGYSVFGAGMALAGYFFIAYYLTVPDFQPGGAIDFSRAAEHQPLLLVAYCLMIVGFGAKAGMMPMQSWLPAAHPVAPAPASAVLSGVITKGGVVAVIRVTYYMFGPEFLAGSWPQYVLLTLTLAEGAQLELTELFTAEAFAEVSVKQAARSRCRLTTVLLSSANASYRIDLDGADAENELGGVFLAAGEEHCVLKLHTAHNVADCRSDSYVKGVAGGQAVGEFCGMVYVAPDAQRTDARQQSRNILLSRTARITTQPQLEIYADDVKCSHGATVGQMDAEAILYMRQRGLNEAQARRLQIEGFVGDVVTRCGIEPLCGAILERAAAKIETL